MTTEQMQELLEAAKPSVIESLKRELTQSISWEVKAKAGELIRLHTEEWIKAHILPEITKSMIESKEGMIAIGVKLAPAIVDEITKAMIAAVAKNMTDSWSRKKFFESLLG